MATAPAPNEPELGFPAKGSLKRFPFPRLLREIARADLTGSLYLLSTQTKKVVFFEAGQPVFVRSNVLSECLGQVLAQEGLITQEQCEQTLEAIRRTGKKQGELLVEMGILSSGNLRYGLQAQLRAKLFDIFSWDDGRYQFKIEDNGMAFGVRLDVSAEGVIVAAVQDRFTEDRARASLRDDENRHPLVAETDGDRGLDLLPEERHFVARLDGSRTLRAVLANASGVPSPAVLVYGLIQAGLVELVDEARAARPAPPSPTPPGAELSDDALTPSYEAQDVVTEYEDTPLPGELPRVRGLLGDHEADFAGVEDEDAGPSPHSVSTPRPKPDLPESLVAAEPAAVEETFEEEAFELTEDDDAANGDAPAVASFDPPPMVAEHAASPALALGHDPTPPPELEPIDGLDAAFGPPPPELTEGSGRHALALEDVEIEAIEPIEPIDPIDAFDPDATVLDAGDIAPPISTDSIGEDLLGADELDQIRIDAGDLAGLELDEPEALPHELSPEALGITPESVDADLALEPAPAGDLMSVDELDGIDLGMPPIAGSPAIHTGAESTFEEEQSPEMLGAVRFNEAESALGAGDYPRAVSLLEEAYDNGFDVAELHAMLAYARFQASGHDRHTADHALELLEYAQTMDPSLDMVHAYRGAIYSALGDTARAREALDRALELNPYCELAMQIMDALG